MAIESGRFHREISCARLSGSVSAAGRIPNRAPGPCSRSSPHHFFSTARSGTRGVSPAIAILSQRSSKIQTAEFQVTGIDAQPGGALRTRVRYELVGTGQGFHREQRVGWWNLEWEAVPSAQYRLRSWQATEETRSRSAKPWYRGHRATGFCQRFFLLRSAPAWCRLLAHGSRRRVRHRYLRPQRRFGWRHRRRRVRRSLCLPARRPSQSALSQSGRWNVRGHHRGFRSRTARKHGLRDLRRLRQ